MGFILGIWPDIGDWLAAQFGWHPGYQAADDRIAILLAQLGANAHRRHVPNGFEGRVSFRLVGKALGPLQRRVGVLLRPTGKERVVELAALGGRELPAQRKRSPRIGIEQGNGRVLQQRGPALAFG